MGWLLGLDFLVHSALLLFTPLCALLLYTLLLFLTRSKMALQSALQSGGRRRCCDVITAQSCIVLHRGPYDPGQPELRWVVHNNFGVT